MNEKQIIKLIGASIFAVLFLWGVYVFSGYYSQWQEKKAQQEQHAREQMDIMTKAGWYILTKEGDDEYILTDSKRQQLYADETEEDDYDDADEYEDTDKNDEYDSNASGGPVIKAGGRLTGESDSKDTSDSDSDTTSSMNTQKKKKYDPYDVYDYDDPDDFADEWAEEFGDGDYDNGYDDAYDYWEEKNR